MIGTAALGSQHKGICRKPPQFHQPQASGKTGTRESLQITQDEPALAMLRLGSLLSTVRSWLVCLGVSGLVWLELSKKEERGRRWRQSSGGGQGSAALARSGDTHVLLWAGLMILGIQRRKRRLSSFSKFKQMGSDSNPLCI